MWSSVQYTVVVLGMVMWAAAFVEGIDAKLSRETLQGITGVGVLIESIGREAERDGLTRARLQTDIELRLRKAGIAILTLEEVARTPGHPYLYLAVNPLLSETPLLYAVSIQLSLSQSVILLSDYRRFGNDTLLTNATTWLVSGVLLAGQSRMARAVRDQVADFVDEFINAYLSVNPLPTGAVAPSRNPDVPKKQDVQQVQERLKAVGFDPGPIDGELGKQTRTALRQYQAATGLPVTGAVDDATRAALGLD